MRGLANALILSIDKAIDEARMTASRAGHSIDPRHPDRCPVCKTDDSVRELDCAIRYNPVSGDGERGYAWVHQIDADFETILFFCEEGCGAVLTSDGVEIDWT